MKEVKNYLLYILVVLVALCIFDYEISFAKPSKTYTNGIGIEFVYIPAGSFSIVTASEAEKAYVVSGKAIISSPFYLGKYPVTQEQWASIMGSSPAHFEGETHPVETVSWNDAQYFIKRLNAKEGTNRYRLPTEMEWELAARGGSDAPFFFMGYPKTREEVGKYYTAFRMNSRIIEEIKKVLVDYAWFKDNSGRTTHPVGQKKPNPYGLYDMYGNVSEWVHDWDGYLPRNPEIVDYRGPVRGRAKVLRGGDMNSPFTGCGSASRSSWDPHGRFSSMGFRLAMSIDEALQIQQ